MSSLVDIGAKVKSRQFGQALSILKGKKKSLDGRGAFKLLRSLATQLRQNSSCDEQEAMNEFIYVCCDILDSSSDLLSDISEFTQGVLSLFYLVSTLAKSPSLPVISKIAETHLTCMRKVSSSIKDVESIAANFFSHLWNLANKAGTDLEHTYRVKSLAILVHGGSSFWNKVIDKLGSVIQEPSQPSRDIATQVFLEFLCYQKVHQTTSMQWTSSIMQAWVLLMFSSKNSSEHQSCTDELLHLTKKMQVLDQTTWLMELVIYVFEALNGYGKTSSVHSLPFPLAEELRVVFIRSAVLTLNTASKIAKQPLEEAKLNKKAHLAVVDGLLIYSEELHKYPGLVETLCQAHVHQTQLKFLARSSILLYNMLRFDEFHADHWAAILRQSDSIISSKNEHLKKCFPFVAPIESTVYNVGIYFYQKCDYSRSTVYSRKALNYCIECLKADSNCDEVLRHFQSRLGFLYDARFRLKDWSGAMEDFGLCLEICLDKKESIAKARLCTYPVFSRVLANWSKLKRDLQTVSPLPAEYLDTSLVDLLDKTGTVLKPKIAWELLHEEFTAIDRRKFNIQPHGALNQIAKKMAAAAQTPLQKGKAYYLLSRVGDDYLQRHAYANTAATILAGLCSQTNTEREAQVYLALSYLELYVSQQELMKKKTEEEMQSLGPLIQSKNNAEVPPGEDGSNVTTDGTSIDALSYSYLKLELEIQSQEWILKCLQQWEELVQFGWTLDQYSNMIFNCLKSLGYFFALYGNSFYSARAWSISLKVADVAKCDDELVLAASELLRLGLTVDSLIFDRCKEIINKNSLTPQEQTHFHLGLAWFHYYQQQFDECWSILSEKVLRAPALNTDKLSKSLFVEEADAALLSSLLSILPEELGKLPSLDTNPAQNGVKAFHSSYTALRCYCSNAEQYGWDFYGQEWNVLRLFLVCAVNASKIYSYIASHREARFFLKEALNAAQRHVCALRTAEALLELCSVELMIDSVMDCQSKLLLICHMMGVVAPVVPEAQAKSLGADKLGWSPPSPVEIRSERRNRTAARKVPEVGIQVEQDATHRTLKEPYNHGGASPTTRAREVTGGVFPEHSLDCLCLTCTSELVTSVRCFMITIQAKLWSHLGFQELANDEFIRGYQMVLTLCARLRPPAKSSSKPSKRLFEVPEGPKINEMWNSQKAQWLQLPLVTGLELMVEHCMYSAVLNSGKKSDETSKVKTILTEFYQGPLEHRMIKLVSAMCVEEYRNERVFIAPEMLDCSAADDSVVVLDGTPPKTPANVQSRPVEVPPPRRNRRNIFGTKVDDTITIEDEDESDEEFSRRRLGKPTRTISFSSDSDSDSDMVPGTPPPVTKSAARPSTRAKLDNKKKEEADSSTDDLKVLKKRATRKIISDGESDDGGSSKKTVKTTGRAAPAQEVTTNGKKAPASAASERKFSKSKGSTSKNEPEDVESDEVNSSVEDLKAAKKRTTRKVALNKESADGSGSKTTTRSNAKATPLPEVAMKDSQAPAPVVKERKFFKSLGQPAKNESDDIELSARLAKTVLDFPEPTKSRPKRTTRSTKK